MNTLVVSNVHREPLCWPHIQDYNPIRTYTADYPYPQIGHYRCFHGHTNALKAHMTDDLAIVMEDDCVPDRNQNWKGAIDVAAEIAGEGKYEIVCLHGRGYERSKFMDFKKGGWTWLYPTTEHRWVLGTLIYIITRRAAERFCNTDFWCGEEPYAGCNIDLFLWSDRFNFCMLETPEHRPVFIHDRSQGSLLENSKNTEYVNR